MNILLADAGTTAGGVIGGLFGVGIVCVLLVLAVVWAFLPFLLLAKLENILKELRALRSTELLRVDQWQRRNDEHLAVMRKYYETPPPREEFAADAQHRGFPTD